MAEEFKLGKYQIFKELGRGGFGIVYEAHDLILGRDVALKVLHSQHAVDRGFIERFGLEARMAAQLEHPHLVSVYDYNEIDGRYIIVMGLMKGGSLKDQIKQYGAFDTFRAKKLLEQILEGIHFIHQNDVVHRDLKPSNILFDQHGTARISDLGFAKALRGSVDSSMSVSGGLVGTPTYMAPEIWHGKKATEQSDIYSLGCIIYEMLTGEALFYGETPAESMTKHLIVGPQMDADLPKPWRELIEKCLAKEPELRYPSASAMLEDLKWGLFDALEEPETEIVLVSNELHDEEISKVSPQLEKVALDYLTDEYVNSFTQETNGDDRACDDVPQEGKEKSSDRKGRETLTPGQMMEFSPFKRLQMRLPWLMPLSLGVLITLMVATLFTKIKDSKFNLASMPTATATATMSQMPTQLASKTSVATSTSTITKISTSTRIPSVTPTPKPTQYEVKTKVREADGMVMVYVSEGTFTMGNNKYDEEKPEREVYLDAYWIDKYEVTNAQYALCVEAGRCGEPFGTDSHTRDSYYGNPEYDDYPVILVPWVYADAYCKWVGGRLPTEAEWEKAARGPNGNKYPWGNGSPSYKKANYYHCVGDTSKVGSYPEGASYYGAMDMAGNVSEWVSDWYGPYDVNKTENPTGPTGPTTSEKNRVIRGGGWGDRVWWIRSTFRLWNGERGTASTGEGFRCVFP
jgi:serine/threonine protein kinase